MQERRRLDLSLALGGLAVLALVLASQLYVWVNLWPVTISWTEALVWSLPQLIVWSLFIPAIVWLARRLPVHGPRGWRRIPIHLVASVGTAVLVLFILDLSDRWLGWSTILGAPSKLISGIGTTLVHLHIGIGIYWVVLAVVHALRYYDESRDREVRASRLETQLARAELQNLRMQLDPHFLFNTLNSIAVLMRHDVEGAERMLHRLSELLQRTLRQGGRHEIALREELAYLRSYLEIEKTRFRDRLTVDYDIDPTALDCAVPALLLQPLVENAVRHGIAPRAGPGRVGIGARRSGDHLELTVRDNGPGLEPGGDQVPAGGVGLTNTRNRLEKMYGSAGRLGFRQPEEGGLEVRVRIPARPVPDGGASAGGATAAAGGPRSVRTRVGDDKPGTGSEG